MTKLLSYFSLCPINNFSEFLGLSRDVDSGSVINTLGKNIILIIKLNNQKQIKSWTVLDRLTNKVVYDFNRKQYVGVFAHRFMRFWDENDEDINKIKKTKFHRKIQDVFTVEFDGKKLTLVLYQDGSCESLDCALESRLSDKDNQDIKKQLNEVHLDYTIDNVKILELPFDRSQLMITYFKKYADLIELNYVTIDKETLKPNQKIKTIKLERSNATLSGFVVVEGTERYPSLLSIWSDKRIFMQTLKYDDNSSTSDTLGNFVSMLDVVNVSQPMSIIGITRDVIAMYAANKNGDGSYVLLYNIKFKIVQSKQYFKVFFKESRIWNIDNNIFLAFGRNLSVIPYHVSEEQLSDMVGSQCDQEIMTLVEKTINEDLEFEEAAKFNENQTEDDSDIDDFIFPPTHLNQKNSSDLKKFANAQEVSDHLREIVRDDITLEVIRDDEQIPGTMQAKLYSNVDENLLILPENFEVFINEFERFGHSEIEITDKILPILIKTNRTSDIGLLLKRYNHISERMLVKTLKYLINAPPVEKKEKKVPESMTVKIKDFKHPSNELFPNQNIFAKEKKTTKNVDVLNILLSCSFDSNIIVKYLRNEIELSELIYIMDYLYEILSKSPLDLCGQDTSILPNPVEADDFDEDKKLFEWFTLLIDSHYQQILLTKDLDLLQKLISWKELVDSHIKILNDMINLRSLLQTVTNGKYTQNTTTTASNKWYSIENVKLY